MKVSSTSFGDSTKFCADRSERLEPHRRPSNPKIFGHLNLINAVQYCLRQRLYVLQEFTKRFRLTRLHFLPLNARNLRHSYHPNSLFQFERSKGTPSIWSDFSVLVLSRCIAVIKYPFSVININGNFTIYNFICYSVFLNTEFGGYIQDSLSETGDLILVSVVMTIPQEGGVLKHKSSP